MANYETVEYYHKLLEEMILQLNLEIALLKGEINLNDLESKFEQEQKVIENKYSPENILEIKN